MKNLQFLVLALFLNLLSAQEKQIVETAKEFQNNLNVTFKNEEKSPLTVKDFRDFKSLNFFPISDKYIVKATFVKAKNEKVFQMKTSTSRQPEYIKYGELHFVLEGKECKLNLYQNLELIKKAGFEDYLFLPFSDQTCGKTSYIGGRYIDFKIPKTTTVTLDFNKAYNPYCAYNSKYSCPKIPLENDLEIEIKAGVKKFHE